MCMQCVATAMTAVGAASGTRAYLGSRRYAWLTPKRLRAITIVLAIGAVLASATLVSGSGWASGTALPRLAPPRPGRVLEPQSLAHHVAGGPAWEIPVGGRRAG